MTDLNQVYNGYLTWRAGFRMSRLDPPLVRIWDGDWNLFSEIHGEFEHSFEFVRNDTGSAFIDLPLDHFVSKWILDPDSRTTKDLHLTFDKDGARWSGKVDSSRVTWGAKSERVLRVTAKHDYEYLKHILVWSNPFLPAEIQIPKVWGLIGPADWALATTLHMNLLRQNASLWMVPDDPLDIGQWVNLDISGWDMVVKPISMLGSSVPLAPVMSRFKDFHSVAKDVAADNQLSIEVRRYLEGDPHPIPGKVLKHGCLVVEIVDKSGWNTETAFGGSLLTGLQRAFKSIGSDGFTEGIHYIEHPDFPAEYSQPGWRGTLPQAPWVVLEDGPYTGVESTEYEYKPPGPVQFVTGGQSMPGVNEGLKAALIAVGGVLGSVFAGQSQLGSVIAEIASPLITDSLMAFQAHKMHDRISELGSNPYFEMWADGADRAYTLSALIALRKAKDETRERHVATVEINDAAPYTFGQNGHGDLFISDRVAIHAAGMPANRLFVEQVETLTYELSHSKRGWRATVGQSEPMDPLLKLYSKWEATSSGLRELGVL